MTQLLQWLAGQSLTDHDKDHRHLHNELTTKRKFLLYLVLAFIFFNTSRVSPGPGRGVTVGADLSLAAATSLRPPEGTVTGLSVFSLGDKRSLLFIFTTILQ